MSANNQHTNRLQYVHYIPPAWRALAILGYLSEILDFGFLLPVAIWFVFRHNRFLRMHALAAGGLHLAGFLISLLVRIPSHFFLLEFTQFFVTPQQLLGMITGSDQVSVGMFLFVTSGGFIMTLLPVLGQSAVQKPGNRHRVNAGELMMLALIALPVTPVLFYTDFLWGNTGQSGNGIFHLYRFQNPYNMFPGHIIALWCVTLSIVAWRGRVAVFTPLSGLFIRLMRAEHSTGERRYREARRRSYVLPGWGELFSGHPVGGLIVACMFLLVLMFVWISLGLNYGRLVEGIPFLNVNFTWFFLSEMGLRTHLLPDKDFRNLFGRPLVLAVLTVMLVAVYAYSQWNVRMLHGRARARPFVLTLAHSVLLHLTPVAVLLLIPVMVSPFLQQPSGAEQTEEQELEFYIPESYDASEEEPEINGSIVSGDEGDAESTAAMRPEQPAEAEERNSDLAERRTQERQLPERREQRRSERKDEETLGNAEDVDNAGNRPGERKNQTYSNYLSVKIRAPEKEFNYWERLPQPYSAVFEYKISAEGRVYDVRVVEPSGHSQADDLTVRLIEAMDRVLPPPGEHGVVVTELFWNTSQGDNNLPTELQRRLSGVFDGRMIEPFE